MSEAVVAATIDVFWTWCDGSCAGSEKLGVWAFLPALVKTEPRYGASWRRGAGRRGPGGGDWKSWRGSKAPGASGTWRGRTPPGLTTASCFWRGRTPPGRGPAGRVGATNVDRRFLDAEVGAAGRGDAARQRRPIQARRRPSPARPVAAGAPSRPSLPQRGGSVHGGESTGSGRGSPATARRDGGGGGRCGSRDRKIPVVSEPEERGCKDHRGVRP